MNTIDLNGVIVGLSTWENQRFSQLPDYALPFFSQGGWEGWLQVEWAMFFTGYGYDIVREQNSYGTRLRADLVFNKQIPGSTEIIAEIKCESIYITTDNFCKLIQADEEKLASLVGRNNGIMLVAVTEPVLERTLYHQGYQTVPSTQNNIRIMYKIVK